MRSERLHGRPSILSVLSNPLHHWPRRNRNSEHDFRRSRSPLSIRKTRRNNFLCCTSRQPHSSLHYSRRASTARTHGAVWPDWVRAGFLRGTRIHSLPLHSKTSDLPLHFSLRSSHACTLGSLPRIQPERTEPAKSHLL